MEAGDGMKHVRWIRLDRQRPQVRIVATRFPSGSVKLLLVGDVSPTEAAGMMRQGYYRSRGGLLLRDKLDFTLGEIRAVFPDAAEVSAPTWQVTHVLPARGGAPDPARDVRDVPAQEDGEGVSRDNAADALAIANRIGATRDLGRNAQGDRVVEGEDGRFVVRTDAQGSRVTIREGDSPAPDRALLLYASTSAQMHGVADGFVHEILAGRVMRFSDVKRWYALMTGVALAEAGTSPGLRDWQEAIEAAITRALRARVGAHTSVDEAFALAQRMEEGQPVFLARTGTSIALQQYSTPLRLAVAVQHIVGDVAGAHILEPTIGNAALVSLLSGAAAITGVDLDPKRIAQVRRDRPEIAAQEGDFLRAESLRSGREDGLFDVVIANPPFGGLPRPVMVGPLKVSRIDHEILVRSLARRTNDGVGVYIIAADSYVDAKAGQVLPASRHVFNWLGDHYDTRVVEVAGSLYGKQGATMPIRIVVVGQKMTGAPAVPERLTVLTQSEELLDWAKAMRTHFARARLRGHDEEEITFDAAALPSIEVTVAEPSRTAGGVGVAMTESGGGVGGAKSDSGDPAVDVPDPRDDDTSPTGSHVTTGSPAPAAEVAAPVLAQAPVGPVENGYQAPYQPLSQVSEGSAMVPRNLDAATRMALADVERAHGDIDAWVATQLGWTVGEMRERQYLSPEQVDAVALMMHAHSSGRGCLEGDQTGVGKGRVMAAMAIREVLAGGKAIFITQTPTLFTDLWRDIRDLGAEHRFRPLIVNAGVPIYDPQTGKTLVPATPRAVMQRALDEGHIPDEYNLVLATYSQFNREAANSAKARWLAGAATDQALLLDEAHNAAGDSNTGSNVSRAIEAAARVAYSSATAIKNAKNVMVYSKLFPDSVSVADLPETLRVGGEVLQEVLSGMMARDGVFVRREHDLSALRFRVATDSKNVERNIAPRREPRQRYPVGRSAEQHAKQPRAASAAANAGVGSAAAQRAAGRHDCVHAQ